MLTRDGCLARLRRFRERLASPWDAAVLHLPDHLLYLANFYPEPTSLNLHSSSFLLVERDGPATIFTDNWAAAEHGDGEGGPGDGTCADRVESLLWYDCKRPAENRAHLVASAVRSRLEKLKVETIFAERAHLPVEVGSAVRRVEDCEPLLRRCREIKDNDELDAIGRGIRTAEAVHAASREILRPGWTELEYYAALLERALPAARAPFVMMCDVASGPRAAAGGGAPTLRQIGEGDLVILDIFPYVEGYRGDITNTLVAGGRPTPEQQGLFDLVLQALLEAERLVRPGTPVREIYSLIDRLFRNPPGGGGLVHHAGHGIGLGHPESPELVPGSDRTLEAGMVITLEPGLYGRSSGGVRLEHDYLVTETGSERLSRHELALV